MYEPIHLHPDLQERSEHPVATAACGVWIVLLFISLFGPTISYGTENLDTPRGYYMLLFGVFGIMDGNLQWFANPIILFAAACARDGRPIVVLLLLGVASWLTISTLSMTEIVADEAGNMAVIRGFGWGYYVWMLSAVIPFGIMVIWAVYALFAHLRGKP